MKPKNPLLNKKNELQLLNKNLNKDLNIDQKMKICINILQNNHKDQLVDKVMKNNIKFLNNSSNYDCILPWSCGLHFII